MMNLFNRNKTIKKLGKPLCSDLPIISICDKNRDLINRIAIQFENINQVEVIEGDIFSVKGDALVSPANSFGEMSGGIDQAIDNHYKGCAQEMATKRIRQDYFGELPVGFNVILKMDSRKFPFLIIAPTMRIPGRLRKDSINVYLAMRGILAQVIRHNLNSDEKIKKIVIPGLGSGVGGLGYQEVAEQMFTAYKMIFDEEWKQIVHPAMAPYALRK